MVKHYYGDIYLTTRSEDHNKQNIHPALNKHETQHVSSVSGANNVQPINVDGTSTCNWGTRVANEICKDNEDEVTFAAYEISDVITLNCKQYIKQQALQPNTLNGLLFY